MPPGSRALRLASVATVLSAFAAAAGLVIGNLYTDTPYWIQQARGTDLATLLVAVPVLVGGLWAARRGSPAGGPAVVAGILYLAYNYAIFAFSIAMNPLTVLYIAILGVTLWTLVLGALSPEIARDGGNLAERLNRRASAGLLAGVAVLFGLLWLGQIGSTTMTGIVPPDLARAGLPTNPVYALDLAFFLPLCAVAGVGLWRRERAAAFALPMLVWVALMGSGVLGGFVLAAVAGDEVPVAVALVIGGLSLGSAALATIPLVRRPAQPVQAATPAPAA